MGTTLHQLWQDDAGIVALEYLLVGTIVGLGLIVGLSNLEIALDNELTELANSVTALDQSYSFAAVIGDTSSSKNGTCVTDILGSQVMTTNPATCATISVVVP